MRFWIREKAAIAVELAGQCMVSGPASLFTSGSSYMRALNSVGGAGRLHVAPNFRTVTERETRMDFDDENSQPVHSAY